MKTSMYSKILLTGFFLICLIGSPIQGQSLAIAVVKQEVQYTCPMHPEVISDKPGECPKCGMKLVEKPKSTLPAELNTIFTTSCMQCHGDKGGMGARSKVDFSKWEEYTAEVKAKKAQAISRTISNGSMPPKGFLNAHPEAVLLKEQMEAVRKWSESFTAQK